MNVIVSDTTDLVELPERSDRDRHEERFRIYSVPRGSVRDDGTSPVLLATTPELTGIGVCLATLRDELTITNHTRVGIKDDVERRWIVNPWAVGD